MRRLDLIRALFDLTTALFQLVATVLENWPADWLTNAGLLRLV